MRAQESDNPDELRTTIELCRNASGQWAEGFRNGSGSLGFLYSDAAATEVTSFRISFKYIEEYIAWRKDRGLRLGNYPGIGPGGAQINETLVKEHAQAFLSRCRNNKRIYDLLVEVLSERWPEFRAAATRD